MTRFTYSHPAVFFASSPFDRSGRMDYVRELMRYLQVHCYGKCLNNRALGRHRLPGEAGHSCALQIHSRLRELAHAGLRYGEVLRSADRWIGAGLSWRAEY